MKTLNKIFRTSKKYSLMNASVKIFCLLFGMTGLIACAPEPDDKALGLAQFEIEPAVHAIIIDGQFQYTSTFTDARGDEQNNIEIIWKSASPEFATISSSGMVTGIAEGQSTITASVTTNDAGLTESNAVVLTIISDPEAVAMVKITNTKTEYFVDNSFQLTSEVSKIDGSLIEPSDILWSTSNSSIATIDENGLVSILSTGSVTITAMVEGISSPGFVVMSRDQNVNRSATLEGARGHRMSGTATLQVNSSGQLELVFSDDYSVQNGPGLEVFLSNTNTPNNTSLNLGPLQSTQGSQTYIVPSNVSIEKYQWIVVYCTPYSVSFGEGQFP